MLVYSPASTSNVGAGYVMVVAVPLAGVGGGTKIELYWRAVTVLERPVMICEPFFPRGGQVG